MEQDNRIEVPKPSNDKEVDGESPCSRHVPDSRHSHAWSDHSSFQFVTIQNPRELDNPHIKRSIRSHAVKRGIDTRRKNHEARSQNFRIVVPARANSPSQRRSSGSLLRAVSQTPPQSLTFGIPQLLSNKNDSSLSRLRGLLQSSE